MDETENLDRLLRDIVEHDNQLNSKAILVDNIRATCIINGVGWNIKDVFRLSHELDGKGLIIRHERKVGRLHLELLPFGIIFLTQGGFKGELERNDKNHKLMEDNLRLSNENLEYEKSQRILKEENQKLKTTVLKQQKWSFWVKPIWIIAGGAIGFIISHWDTVALWIEDMIKE